MSGRVFGHGYNFDYSIKSTEVGEVPVETICAHLRMCGGYVWVDGCRLCDKIKKKILRRNSVSIAAVAVTSECLLQLC